MTQSHTASFSEKSFSDKLIDGLFGGLLAGIAMALAMMFAALVFGEDAVSILGRFSTSQLTTPLNGLIGHLAVSGTYGAIYGSLLGVLPGALRRLIPGWLAGLVYAALLLGLALGFVLPGLRSPLAEVPRVVLASGHLVYGLILGWRVSTR